jgi:hypothetical protein
MRIQKNDLVKFYDRDRNIKLGQIVSINDCRVYILANRVLQKTKIDNLLYQYFGGLL